jgi:hypothetical protein
MARKSSSLSGVQMTRVRRLAKRFTDEHRETFDRLAE